MPKFGDDRPVGTHFFRPPDMAKKTLKTNIIVAWQANLVLVLRDEYDLVFREYIFVFCCFCLPCGLARPLISLLKLEKFITQKVFDRFR